MYAQIIIDITSDALDRAYTYRIPEGMEVSTGDRVSIPFGVSNAVKTGYVIGLSDTVDYDPEKVKEIKTVMHDSLLCALDQIFNDAIVSTIKGQSFRGKKLETVALQPSKLPYQQMLSDAGV